MTMNVKPKIAVVYHFFPHYRSGVIKAIDREFDATFLGDKNGVEGILPFKFSGQRFRLAPCIRLGRLIIQPAVISYVATSKDQAFVFLANPNHISTWIAAVVAKLRGKRVIFWGHGFLSSESSFKNRIRRLFFSIADAFYAYGWRAKQNAVALGFQPKSIHVGFNSLDYEEQLPLRAKVQRLAESAEPSDHLSIICVSRLTRLCRYDLLLEAMRVLQERHINTQVTFIGDGPARGQLETQASKLGLAATFLGAIYDEELIADLVFRADVTVSPGKVGLTAMHSLMFGTPVITHGTYTRQMPEVEAIVPGKTGLFFEEGNANSLADALESLGRKLPNREVTRDQCFAMIDRIYNPIKQVEVLKRAVAGDPAEQGDDAFRIFNPELIT